MKHDLSIDELQDLAYVSLVIIGILSFVVVGLVIHVIHLTSKIDRVIDTYCTGCEKNRDDAILYEETTPDGRLIKRNGEPGA